MIGGDIHLINENPNSGEMNPDYMWRGKLWELKNITTPKAADSAIRKGLKQIKNNPGGLILELDNDIDIDELKTSINDRMKRGYSGQIDIIVKRKQFIKFIWRYKK